MIKENQLTQNLLKITVIEEASDLNQLTEFNEQLNNDGKELHEM